MFPVGARLDSAVTSEELREKFNFEPEFNKDGTPMVRRYFLYPSLLVPFFSYVLIFSIFIYFSTL